MRTAADGRFDWYLNTCNVLLRDPSRAAILLITTALLVDPKDSFISKAGRLLEENAFIKSHYTKFGHLGAREKEVLRLLALGKTAQEIAAELFIATSTAETHRKNIRKKLRLTRTMIW